LNNINENILTSLNSGRANKLISRNLNLGFEYFIEKSAQID